MATFQAKFDNERAGQGGAWRPEVWVVVHEGGDLRPADWPDFDADFGVEVVVADDTFAVVRAVGADLERVCADYPRIRVCGHPANGRYIASSGAEAYIYDGRLLPTERHLWWALGLEPAYFGGLTWDDVDEDVVRGYVPTF